MNIRCVNWKLSECQEYKNLVGEDHTTLVCPMYELPNPECFKTIKTYECNQFTGLIVGGQITQTGEFPHMAAIGYKVNGGIAFSCGGSLISERFVLTVAHCKDFKWVDCANTSQF